MSRKIKVEGEVRRAVKRKSEKENERGGGHAVFVAEENTRRDGEGVEAAWRELGRGARGGGRGGPRAGRSRMALLKP